MEKEINEMKDIDIYKQYIKHINGLYKNFEFLGITKEEYKEIVLKIIAKSKTKYDGSTLYHIYLKEKINTYLQKYLKKCFSNFETTYEIISKFINSSFEKPSMYSFAIYYLKKLTELFQSVGYFPDPDLIIKLINENNKLNKCLSTIVNNNIKDIENNNIDKIFNETIGFMIKTYCEINNIASKDDILIADMSDSNTTDSIRIYFNELSDIPLLTPAEEEKYGYMLLEGSEEAKRILIESNLRFAITVAARYISTGMPLGDLIQDANEGLIHAVNKYDVRKGYRFSTYAGGWISCKIIRSLYLNIYKQQKFNAISLDEFVGEDEDNSLSNIIYDEDSLDDEKLILKVLPYEIKKLFTDCKLTEKEIFVMTKRYGLDGGIPQSLIEIAQRMNGVTRERIRQIEAHALKKIRMSKYIKNFAIYLDNPEEGIEKLMKMRMLYSENKNNTVKKDLDAMLREENNHYVKSRKK